MKVHTLSDIAEMRIAHFEVFTGAWDGSSQSRSLYGSCALGRRRMEISNFGVISFTLFTAWILIIRTFAVVIFISVQLPQVGRSSLEF